MVLSMTDQHKPKCYLCSNVYENIDELRKHQENDHKDFVEFHKNTNDRSPTPGDVTVFQITDMEIEDTKHICWFCKKGRHDECMKKIPTDAKSEGPHDCTFDTKLIDCKCLH